MAVSSVSVTIQWKNFSSLIISCILLQQVLKFNFDNKIFFLTTLLNTISVYCFYHITCKYLFVFSFVSGFKPGFFKDQSVIKVININTQQTHALSILCMLGCITVITTHDTLSTSPGILVWALYYYLCREF